jgi:hypothetical protein
MVRLTNNDTRLAIFASLQPKMSFTAYDSKLQVETGASTHERNLKEQMMRLLMQEVLNVYARGPK